MSPVIHPSISAAVAAARHTAVAPLAWNPVEHLLSRFTFGATPGQRAWVAQHGIGAWYSAQLTAGATYRGYTGMAGVPKTFPLLAMSPAAMRRWNIAQGQEYGWYGMDQLTQATLALQVWSRAQLYETVVDLFSNHLNVANHNGDLWVTRHTHDRDVVRRHAFGTFTDMLLASAKNPAMLQYLNLAESTKAAVNENYGRELLELHTVGLHYSESDVKNAAKLLTGRTVDDESQRYVYDASIHGTGAVKILGFRHANSSAAGGEKAGDAFLRYLARHPFTARNLARKMCLRFVSDAPSAALVDAVARAYTDGGTAILPMVSTILRSTEFWQSRGRKVRRPMENLAATIRTLGVTPSNLGKATGTLHWMSINLGHCPLEWPAPNGYPDVAAAWRSSGTLLQLWEMHLGMAGGWWDGLSKPDLAALYTGASTSRSAVTTMAHRLTGTAFSSAHTTALQTFLGEPASTPVSRSSLSWQQYPLAALVLDGPHHALR